MFNARQILRSAPRFARQAARAPAQRRLMSSPATTSSGTENAFIRERKAVKDHAAGTTGTFFGPPPFSSREGKKTLGTLRSLAWELTLNCGVFFQHSGPVIGVTSSIISDC